MIRLIKNRIHKFQAYIANIRYGFPAKNLKIIGVTGTDGKTTTVSMIYHILKASGMKVGMISTIEVLVGDKSLDSGLHVTTPDPWVVPKYLKMMKKAGMEYVVLESTSNGLDQNRLSYIEFDAAIITNIREDHLDYHKTWENYARAKFKLIEGLRHEGLAVLNQDDEKSAKWLTQRSDDLKQLVYVKWVSKRNLKNKSMSIKGLEFDLDDIHFRIPILGEHNFENALQAIRVMQRYLPLEKIKDALTSFKTPEGRMQIMQSKPFGVIVDFAHTPGALQRALESVVSIKHKNSRIIAVFGCAGKRDKGRRRMGAVSAKMADITILTSEDPRDELLEEVNDEIILHGVKEGAALIKRFANRKLYQSADLQELQSKVREAFESKHKPFFAFDENSPRSREDAIDLALKLAEKNDIVFITGKGHEKSLAFGAEEREYPWSDQEAVKKKLMKIAEEA
ncbi:UDP-N-acetylmuramyl-tripeptide synthetase [Candidatus Dojkabacteria bacterium]|nr:UDP-N-acetylmuramyl-tripeptide synthetase [Candidatus Dojkabacteria bacterium]